MKLPTKFLGLVGLIILVYLLLAHYTGTARIISSSSSAFNSGVKTLQGR